MSEWKPIGRVPPSRLVRARIQAHHAVQPLARAARAALEPIPGDHHTNLGWDVDTQTMWTHPLGPGLKLGLRPADLALRAQAADLAPASLVLSGSSPTDAESWVRDRLDEARIDTGGLFDPLPYELPGESIHRFAAAGDTLTELAAWFDGGQRALARSAVEDLGLDAGVVRCWPHHFDLGALRVLDEDADPEQAPSISIGMSPGDESYDRPYFYVTPWPKPDSGTLPGAPIGRWHTEGFVGLVLTGEELAGVEDPGEVAERFLAESVAVCRRILSRDFGS